jgi:hypothetical protein
MLPKKTIDVGKTSFEKRLYQRLELTPLYETDLNLKLMKKNTLKNISNETLYNYILNNTFYYINNYYILLSIYYPIYMVSTPSNNITDVNVRNINFIYDNDDKNNINFITFFYNSNITDDKMSMENFIFFSYGINLESADGEVKLKFYTKAYFYYLFNYNRPEVINFLDKIYENFLKYDFFKKNTILITENSVLVNNIFYFKFLSFFVFNIYNTYKKKLLYNNINKKLLDFIKKNNIILDKIYNEFSTTDISKIGVHYDKMMTNVYPKYKKEKEITKLYAYNMIYYYDALNITTKYIPKDFNNYYLNELDINYKINLLLFNNITIYLPLTIKHYNIKNKFTYNNPYIISKFLENKKYLEIINLLTDLQKKHTFNKKDININTTSVDNLSENIDSIVSKLNRNIISDESIVIFMEDVGRPFYDYPRYISNLIKQKKKTLTSAEAKKDMSYIYLAANSINTKIFYFNIQIYLFNIIYTLYSLNTKINIIHRDLHLNNLTVNINSTNRFVNAAVIMQLQKKYTFEFMLNKLFVVNRNLFILKNKNIKNNAFLIPTNNYNLTIIDFSRALNKTHKVDTAEKLYEMVLEIYPQYSNNKQFKDKLYKISLLNTDILFDIMTGYDIYYLLKNLYSFFTDKQFLKLKFFPQLPVKDLNFIYKMFNHLDKTMLKNIKKLMNNNFKGYITNTNELLLYKFFNQYLLKNYNKEDFYKPKPTKLDRPCYFQFLDDDEWKYLIESNQIYIQNIFNINNKFDINNLEQYINTYIHNYTNNNKKINQYIK